MSMSPAASAGRAGRASPGHGPAPVRLDDEARRRLEQWARSVTAPARVVRRSRIVLLAHDGVPATEAARRLGTTPATVRRWCGRVAREGPDAVTRDAPGRGRRPRIDEGVRRDLVSLRHVLAGEAGEIPTLRQLAARSGLSAASVCRALRREGIAPARRQRESSER